MTTRPDLSTSEPVIHASTATRRAPRTASPKVYSTRHGDAPTDLDAYRAGVELALSHLPPARPSEGRPGLGFVIVHRGRGTDYVVLAWWGAVRRITWIRVMSR